jgi:uncharacterized protein YrzB (UPF0473 family)
MYGINLLEVGRILGTTVVSNVVLHQYGAIRLIYQEIIKYSARQDIDMVKTMMRTLAQQNERAYQEVVEILQEHFTEQELAEILPQ